MLQHDEATPQTTCLGLRNGPILLTHNGTLSPVRYERVPLAAVCSSVLLPPELMLLVAAPASEANMPTAVNAASSITRLSTACVPAIFGLLRSSVQEARREVTF
jgi:hypothetical protein